MKENDAIKIAIASRSRFGVPDLFQPRASEKRIIELVAPIEPVGDILPNPGPVRDIIAWVVVLGHETAEVEFAIDDSNGHVVRFRRSRNAACLIEERRVLS